MLDPIPLSCLLLLLWLVARDLSAKKSRSEPPPLLPQHQNNVRYTVTLQDVEQQSASEHQHQNVPPPKAQYVHQQRDEAVAPKPLQSVQFSVPAVSQQRDQAPPEHLPLQINEPVRSPVLVHQVSTSSTKPGSQTVIASPRQEAVQVYQVTEAPLVPDSGGEVSLSPQDLDDYNSSDYDMLRERAKQETEAVRKCRKEKKQAKANGQLKLTQELAQQVLMHRKRRQLFDEQASSLIFAKNNKNGSLDRVDLHGLTAEEAVTRAKSAVDKAREGGIARMRFIVGKGLHSSGPPVLKPCILKLMQKLKLPAEVDPSNEGALVVQLIPANNESPPVVVDQIPFQPSLSPTSPLVQSPVFIPEINAPLIPAIHAPPTQFHQQLVGSYLEPVQNSQAAPTFLVPVVGEEVLQFPQNSTTNNADDGTHSTVILREYAKQEKTTKRKCRKEKKLAKARGQTMLVVELARKEREHRERCQLYDAQASDLIFDRNNQHGLLDWVVLHELKAKEAKAHTTRVIDQARAKGKKEIRLVVGEGPGVPGLQSVMLNFLRKKRNLPVEVDAVNKGVLVVKLNPGGSA